MCGRLSRNQPHDRFSPIDSDDRLEELEDDELDDVEKTIAPAELLGYELEMIDEERGIVRIKETGELRRYGNDGDEFSSDGEAGTRSGV